MRMHTYIHARTHIHTHAYAYIHVVGVAMVKEEEEMHFVMLHIIITGNYYYLFIYLFIQKRNWRLAYTTDIHVIYYGTYIFGYLLITICKLAHYGHGLRHCSFGGAGREEQAHPTTAA